jgi:CheY-like chemotaxis protein
MRVLIADDDRDTVMTLGILLRSEGHEIWLAQRGLEVAEAVREFKPRLILLDMGMPDRSGFDVAEELFREYGAACPILVAVTGHNNSAERARAEISGFHHFFAKPYDPNEVLALVAQLDR